MVKLKLSIAIGNYDRVRPLFDGAVQIDGVDPIFMQLPPDESWVRGGIDDPSRPEKITIKLPGGVRLENAPEGKTISQLLEEGAIDAFIAPRVPRLAGKNNPNIGWLFPDPIAAGKDYFKRTGIFPIMHVTGIRRTLVDAHPWLPAAVLKAFEQAKTRCLEELEDTATSKCTLPF